MPPCRFLAIEGSWGLLGRAELPQRRFLGALLKAQLKDLAVSDAAGGVVDGDATYSADLRNSAAVEA